MFDFQYLFGDYKWLIIGNNDYIFYIKGQCHFAPKNWEENSGGKMVKIWGKNGNDYFHFLSEMTIILNSIYFYYEIIKKMYISLFGIK